MFIVESVIMKKFKHKNILNLIGLSFTLYLATASHGVYEN